MDIREAFRSRTGCTLEEEQILLVGSNPLPVAIAALALKPKTGIHLVHTPEVAVYVPRLEQLLKGREISVLSQVSVPDASQPSKVRDCLGTLTDCCMRSGLHYTGGTKAMAIATYAFWVENRGNPKQASYLGSDGTLGFHDGPDVPLRDEPKLSLDDLFQLHMGKKPVASDEHRSEGRRNLAAAIRQFILSLPNGWADYKQRLPPLYGKGPITLKDMGAPAHAESYHLASPKNFADGSPFASWDLGALCRALSISGTTIDDVVTLLGEPRVEGSAQPTKEEQRKKRLDATTWLWAEWLEVWLAGLLAAATLPDGEPLFDEVRQSVRALENGETLFEADVIATRGHTAYLFSCTVDENKGLVKHKLFEAKERAQQLGGDHARAAIVSLSHTPGIILNELKRSWAGYGTIRSFGKDHVLDASTEASTMMSEIRNWVHP